MHIKDYAQAQGWFRKHAAAPSSVGSWKAFVARNKRAQEPRNMYAGGQLVTPSVDGSRPGYSGWPARFKKFIQHFKQTFKKLPTQNEIHIGTGAAAKTIKSHLNVGTDFIITS